MSEPQTRSVQQLMDLSGRAVGKRGRGAIISARSSQVQLESLMPGTGLDRFGQSVVVPDCDVRRQSRRLCPSQQIADRHTLAVATQIPQREVHARNRHDDDTFLAVRQRVFEHLA